MDKKDKENRLLATAFDLFTKKGVNNTSIQDIADSAGVGKGTFYLYFKDKYDIRDKVIANCSSKLFSDALVALENSYIQNSGVDYILDNQFDVVSIYDGTVTKVEDNELAGKTVEIKHDGNIISVYQSLGEVSVKQGDTVKQGSKIGKSGNSKINKDLGNHLHFELYVKGQVVNPEDCYNKKISDFK